MAIRFEEKYICSEGELRIVSVGAGGLLRRDAHGQNGRYTVRSLYFDSADDKCLEQNEDGTDFRKKYRLRLYDGNSDFIRLEVKSRRGETSEKTSVPVSRELADALISCRAEPGNRNYPPSVRELAFLCRAEGFRPAAICEYTREAYTGEPGHVRVTLDRQLRTVHGAEQFFDASLKNAVPVFPVGTGLLEVKYTALLPAWISNAVIPANLRRTAFSKYRMSRLSPFFESEQGEKICLTR